VDRRQCQMCIRDSPKPHLAIHQISLNFFYEIF
jgi:hypothetical protein